MTAGLLVALVSGCDPSQPDKYKGAPIDVSLQPAPVPKTESSPNPKIGTSRQLEEAREQSDEVGPHAKAPIEREQLEFGPSAGETEVEPSEKHG